MGLTDYSHMDKEFYLSGVKAEQERIIKLLQERIEAYYNTGNGSSIETAAYEKVIALIKGENK